MMGECSGLGHGAAGWVDGGSLTSFVRATDRRQNWLSNPREEPRLSAADPHGGGKKHDPRPPGAPICI